ncbi:MAG: dephospho-CoA kinase [Vulcanimicrobiota bacterium]
MTGGIAAGKSTVAEMLADLGATVIDADQVSRRLMQPGSPVLLSLADAFGPETLDAQGELNRAWLGERVFGDEVALARLNALTHPPIWRAISEDIEALRGRVPVIVLMAPLLYEHQAEDRVDEVWVIDLSAESQLQRLQQRNGLSLEAARARVAAQMPIAEKARRADVVIDNSRSLEATRQQVENCWNSRILPRLS